MPFIIDGTNLLRAVENIDTDVITDIAMCNTIARYLLLIAQKGELVFDGTGPPDEARLDNNSNLEVSFAGLAVEADDVIEDKINASTAPRTLTVVSSDRRLRNAAKARRAVSIKCEKEASSEPQAKRSGLTQGETDQWLKFFQIDD
jgi:predicted RNA-binding protein with PIN domain